jgi:hypothetical protein
VKQTHRHWTGDGWALSDYTPINLDEGTMYALGAIVDIDCQKLDGNYSTNLLSCHLGWAGQQMILISNPHLTTQKTSQFQEFLDEESHLLQDENRDFHTSSSLDSESCTAGFPTARQRSTPTESIQKTPAFPRESRKKNLCNAFS